MLKLFIKNMGKLVFIVFFSDIVKLLSILVLEFGGLYIILVKNLLLI